MSESIRLQNYPCERRKTPLHSLVLLHGWGNDSRVWEPMLPALCRYVDVITLDLPGFGGTPACGSWQEVVDRLVESLPARFNLLGWSLGGMLAVQLAHRHPDRVAGLVTLAANACYVRRSDWKTAMPVAAFDDFYQGFVADPEATLQRFFAIQSRGDSEERNLLRWFRAGASVVSPAAFLHGLDWLRQLDNREALRGLKIPSLHLFGGNDQLVTSEAAAKIARLGRKLRVRVLDGAGHAPQISRPEEVAGLVTEFLMEIDHAGSGDAYRLHKRQVADAFGRAAPGYDGAADLQRRVGERLMTLIPAAIEPLRIADMGCGTGYFTARLAARFPAAACTGIDLSPGMLDVAAARHGRHSRLNWLCGDAEALALEAGRFDLIYSNFTFQWCQNLPRLVAEQWRVLRPGGLLVFSTPGPHSLWQLREAWRQVDNYVHVNRFPAPEAVADSLKAGGFRLAVRETETLTRHYHQLGELTGELKAWGAHNLNSGRNRRLTGRRQLLGLKAAYERFRTDRGLPADWQIHYVVARKPGSGAR